MREASALILRSPRAFLVGIQNGTGPTAAIDHLGARRSIVLADAAREHEPSSPPKAAVSEPISRTMR